MASTAAAGLERQPTAAILGSTKLRTASSVVEQQQRSMEQQWRSVEQFVDELQRAVQQRTPKSSVEQQRALE